MAKSICHAFCPITLVGCSMGSRLVFFPSKNTPKALGFSRTMPWPSKGWEKDRVSVTVRLSCCMTMLSDGISMPKCAWATPVKSSTAHADKKPVVLFFIFFIIVSFYWIETMPPTMGLQWAFDRNKKPRKVTASR